jgi:hypothetical protein
LRAYIPRIHAAHGELVIVGNGSVEQVRHFVADYALTIPVMTDPALGVYRALEARRGGGGIRSIRNALRAMRGGFFQWRVLGDARQHGGLFVVMPGGEIAYQYVSELAGDHPDPEQAMVVIEATEGQA